MNSFINWLWWGHSILSNVCIFQCRQDSKIVSLAPPPTLPKSAKVNGYLAGRWKLLLNFTFPKHQNTQILSNQNILLHIQVLYYITDIIKNGILFIFALTIRDQIRSDQSLSRVRLFATPWIAARQASLSITNSWSSLRLTSIESVTILSTNCDSSLINE